MTGGPRDAFRADRAPEACADLVAWAEPRVRPCLAAAQSRAGRSTWTSCTRSPPEPSPTCGRSTPANGGGRFARSASPSSATRPGSGWAATSTPPRPAWCAAPPSRCSSPPAATTPTETSPCGTFEAPRKCSSGSYPAFAQAVRPLTTATANRSYFEYPNGGARSRADQNSQPCSSTCLSARTSTPRAHGREGLDPGEPA